MANKRKYSTDRIQLIPLADLHERPDHPIKMRDDATMLEIKESVKENGILTPGIVRPREDGGYEIISGRRRKIACEEAGLETMPVIVRELDDDEAIIAMVDSGIQRDEVLPSEKAAAYKLKLDAIKRQGERTDLTSRQDDGKSEEEKKEAAEIVGEATGDSARQVQRYIRLNELAPDLLKMVDEKKIGMTPAVEISYLSPHEQDLLLETIDSEQATPSFAQAQKMKKMSSEGTLNEDTMLQIMCQQKKPCWDKITLKGNEIRKYFPENYTPLDIQQSIYAILKSWHDQQETDVA